MTSKLNEIPAIDVKISYVDRMRMVYVPAGEFIMGSNEDDPQAGKDEKPQRKIYLDAFWIDQTSVTNSKYAKFLNKKGDDERVDKWLDTSPSSYRRIFKIKGVWQCSNDYKGYEEAAISCVTWLGAEAYAQWASCRLPTEAQWEKAARGPDGRKYPWGNEEPDHHLIDYYQEYYHKSLGVGRHPNGASPYGAVDMVGGIPEWVADYYEENYYATMPSKNPHNDGFLDRDNVRKVVRGGSWREGVGGDVRVAVRSFGSMTRDASVTYGFRCVKKA